MEDDPKSIETTPIFQPSSRVASSVGLADCIEELLSFILSTSIETTPEVDLGLSQEFRSCLLKDDALKRLASALLQRTVSGSFSGYHRSLKKEEDEWAKMVNQASGIVNMLKAVEFELHVQEPFFSQLRLGTKTVEGRCAVGDYQRIGKGSVILINKCLVLEVEDVTQYASFSEMLQGEGLERVLPGVKTREEGVKIYRNFYTEEKEKSNGVLAIRVSRPAAQPYIALTGILSGLGHDGLQRFLGLMN